MLKHYLRVEPSHFQAKCRHDSGPPSRHLIGLGVFFVEDNELLTTLDLSWNHLRGTGAIGIARGVEVISYSLPDAS